MASLSAHLAGTDFVLGNGRVPVAQKSAVGAAGAVALGAAAIAGKALVDRRAARREQQARQAFRLAADETVPDGVRRIARGQVEMAIAFLSDGGDREAAVHETRKALKRVRALLRLARGTLDPGTHRVENGRFRDVGRRLGVARDSRVMVETFDAVRDRFSAELPAEHFERLRSRLVAEHQEAQRQLDADEVVLASAVRQLETAWTRVPAWTLAHEHFRALAPGLRRLYRRGRRAANKARREPSTENLHELRKRAKDLWYATQILRGAGPSRLRRIRRGAHEVSDLLGEDHDLALLRGKVVERGRDFPEPADQVALLGVIDRRREQLERKALRRAKRLYAAKPRAFVRTVEKRWDKRMQAGAEPVAA
jgi:CHAD domain-containing protein